MLTARSIPGSARGCQARAEWLNSQEPGGFSGSCAGSPASPARPFFPKKNSKASTGFFSAGAAFFASPPGAAALRPGTFVPVKITGAEEHDLLADVA